MKIRRRCKCGCGCITNPGRKWINGHNAKEYKQSEEHKRKRSISMMGNTNGKGNKGKIRSEEIRLKNSISQIKYDPNYEYDGSWQDEEYKKDLRKDYCENKDCKGNYKRLVNHHIDLNKKNSHPKNIMTLCNRCHASLHRKLQDGRTAIIVNPKSFLIINKSDYISYINKRMRKRIIIYLKKKEEWKWQRRKR